MHRYHHWQELCWRLVPFLSSGTKHRFSYFQGCDPRIGKETGVQIQRHWRDLTVRPNRYQWRARLGQKWSSKRLLTTSVKSDHSWYYCQFRCHFYFSWLCWTRNSNPLTLHYFFSSIFTKTLWAVQSLIIFT